MAALGAATDATFSGADGRDRDDTVDELAPLVDAAREGDRAAFDELVRRTWSTTYTLAFRLTGTDDDAREVCQETYLRAYRSIKRFRGDARFTTWLHRITANCASSHLGRRRRHRHDRLDGLGAIGGPDGDESRLEPIDTMPAHDPAGRAEHADLRGRVQGALGRLPAKLRAVVVLRDIYDLTHDEIAAELGISVSAAKVRLHRARRRLRDDLFLAGDAPNASNAPNTPNTLNASNTPKISDTSSASTTGERRVVRSVPGASAISVRRRRPKGGGDVDPRPL